LAIDLSHLFYQARCLTHDISIARFQRSRLTDDFIFAIQELSNLGKTKLKYLFCFITNFSIGKDGLHEKAKELYKKFVQNFGTHFIRKADYGAR